MTADGAPVSCPFRHDMPRFSEFQPEFAPFQTPNSWDIAFGSLQPSRGALEAACRWLRTTAMFRPKIPEVLAAVREAGIMYKTALRAIDELPGQIEGAECLRRPGCLQVDVDEPLSGP